MTKQSAAGILKFLLFFISQNENILSAKWHCFHLLAEEVLGGYTQSKAVLDD